MLLTILVALAVVSLIAYVKLNKKETKQEPEIKHVIAEVEPIRFEEEPQSTPTRVIVETAPKAVKKKSTAKKTTAKKSTKNGQ